MVRITARITAVNAGACPEADVPAPQAPRRKIAAEARKIAARG